MCSYLSHSVDEYYEPDDVDDEDAEEGQHQGALQAQTVTMVKRLNISACKPLLQYREITQCNLVNWQKHIYNKVQCNRVQL